MLPQRAIGGKLAGEDTMARFKHIDTQPQFVAVDLQAQLLPGTFAFALNHLVDHDLDLSALTARYCNDLNGAPAFHPGMLLKVILLGYAHGMLSSRALEAACREHILFMALCGGHAPHFTTFARFVRLLAADIAQLFAQILAVCDQQGLIGRELFAIDGVKLPCNAAKGKSGTRADFIRQHARLERAATAMLEQHRQADDAGWADADRLARTREALSRQARQLQDWLASHPEDKRGARHSVVKSNRTDNDSAKMATAKGVIQGYCGIATVDARHQIILGAHATGNASEQAALLPEIARVRTWMRDDTLITADAGYHSEANLAALEQQGIQALIADRDMRQRDARFASRERYKQLPSPLHNKAPSTPRKGLFRPADFTPTADGRALICPAGRRLHSSGSHVVVNGLVGHAYNGSQSGCGPCALRRQCLQKPDTTPFRQVTLFRGRVEGERASDRMRRRIDSEAGRRLYGWRLATVEPVFANIRHHKKLNRFTLRGQTKVNTQWLLFCLVHNIEKLAHNGYRTGS